MPAISRHIFAAFKVDRKQTEAASRLRSQVDDLITEVFEPGETWKKGGKDRVLKAKLRDSFPAHFEHPTDAEARLASILEYAANNVYATRGRRGKRSNSSKCAEPATTRSSKAASVAVSATTNSSKAASVAKRVVIDISDSENEEQVPKKPSSRALGKKRRLTVSPAPLEIHDEIVSTAPSVRHGPLSIDKTSDVGGGASDFRGSEAIASSSSGSSSGSGHTYPEVPKDVYPPASYSYQEKQVWIMLRGARPPLHRCYDDIYEAGLRGAPDIAMLSRSWGFERIKRWVEDVNTERDMGLSSMEVHALVQAIEDYC